MTWGRGLVLIMLIWTLWMLSAIYTSQMRQLPQVELMPIEAHRFPQGPPPLDVPRNNYDYRVGGNKFGRTA